MLWSFRPSLLAVTLAGSLAGGARAQDRIDFDRDVRPIFEARCVRCHGPERQRMSLRLDRRAAAMAGGRGGAVIVPGDPDASELIARVAGTHGKKRMPAEGEPLTAAQIDVLRRWIVAGAAWPEDHPVDAGALKHWAYRPIVRPAVPAGYSTSPIDAFLLARLNSEDITPSPRADAPTLLRRLCLVVTGLPPTLEQARAASEGEFDFDSTLDELLASPHYGEHRARFWLDLARYADTKGYEADRRRPHVWRYRDWVVDAFNADLPFDRFVTEQLAGDLLPDATSEQRVATAFHRMTMNNDEGGTDDEEFRCEAIVDRVDTTLQVFMGTTMTCVRCHDHKYDPFSHREYYQLFAFFNQTEDADRGDEAPRLEVETPFGKAAVPVMRELPDERRRATHIHLRGSFLAKGDPVEPATPAVFHEFPADAPRNRLGLAQWIVDARNPLTARVTVNRVWEQIFGRGLVATSEDWGTQGERPSHPALLDWLAHEFIADGWSIKRLIGRIARSQTFRRASRHRDDLRDIDPENRLLARGPRIRLSGEAVRDTALTASGLLNRQLGGPSVMPLQPPGIWSNTYSNDRWKNAEDDARHRRGLYTFWRRTAHYPAFAIFDAPSRELCAIRRIRTNTPLQALVLLNDPAFLECTIALARAVDPSDALGSIFLRCLTRLPTAQERERLERYQAEELARFRDDPAAANALVGAEDPELAARAMTCSVVLNLDEFVTRR